MRWKLKPSSFVKTVAAGLSVFTMTIAPVAQGAGAVTQREAINRYLKETGLTTKKMTIGEYWKMVRHVYPEPLQGQMDYWVQENRNEMMPKIEATTFKDKNNNEQVRLTMTRDGESMNLTFTGDEEAPMKYNSLTFKKSELNSKNLTKVFERIAKEDTQAKKDTSVRDQRKNRPVLMLTISEFRKLTLEQQAEYLVRMRYAAEAAAMVYKAHYGLHAYQDLNERHKWAFEFLFGKEAQAADPKVGDNCIVAGYFTEYGKRDDGKVSCGAGAAYAGLEEKMKAHKSNCNSSSSVACNPLVYGYGTCVPRQPASTIKRATELCTKASPLVDGGDKKRIIESYLKRHGKNIDLKIVKNASGQDALSPDQLAEVSEYLGKLRGYIAEAKDKCSQPPLAPVRETMIDQDDACRLLESRAIDLETFITNPVDDCASRIPGSVRGSGGECKCPEGTRKQSKNEGGRTTISCVMTGADNNCGFFCRNKKWLVILGAFVGFGLLWSWFKKGDKVKTPQPVDPEFPGGTITPSPTPTGTIDPPGPPNCPYPNTWNGVVCVPPVVVPPDDTGEGGTKVEVPGRGGVVN